MVRREYVRILPHESVRDESIERRLVEMSRERIVYILLLIGASLLLVAVLW